MKLNLPKPGKSYDRTDETLARKAIEGAVVDLQGKAEDVMIINGRRIFWEDEATGAICQVYLDGNQLKVGDPI